MHSQFTATLLRTPIGYEPPVQVPRWLCTSGPADNPLPLGRNLDAPPGLVVGLPFERGIESRWPPCWLVYWTSSPSPMDVESRPRKAFRRQRSNLAPGSMDSNSSFCGWVYRTASGLPACRRRIIVAIDRILIG